MMGTDITTGVSGMGSGSVFGLCGQADMVLSCAKLWKDDFGMTTELASPIWDERSWLPAGQAEIVLSDERWGGAAAIAKGGMAID